MKRVVPAGAALEDGFLELARVFRQVLGGLLAHGEGELPHGRGLGEGHGVDAGGAVHGLEDAAPGKRDCLTSH